MTVELRFQQLLSYWSCWRANADDHQAAYGLLSCIGYLKRSGLLGEELGKLREIEVEVRKNLSATLEALGKFMSQSCLHQEAGRILNAPDDEDALRSFYLDRDNAQLAWQVAQEYTDDECPPNYTVIGQVRKLLDEADDLVLFDADLVQRLRHLGESEPVSYADPDFFWWLPAERGACHLPGHRRDEYMARYVDGCLPSESNILWPRHLMSCQDCRERWQAFKKELAHELTSMVQFRPKLAAAATEGEAPVYRFWWRDATETWEALIDLENSAASADAQPIYWRLSNTKQPQVNWQSMRLCFGSLEMGISPQGYACCERIRMQEQGATDCTLFFQTDATSIVLDFRGKKDA